MASFFWKTFGGFRPAYYFRHFIFGSMFPGIIYLSTKNSFHPPSWEIYLFCIGSSLLYPYSRFVYESVVRFVVGDNVFFLNGGVYLFWKFATMFACWSLAVIVAPLGLTHLYIYHSRRDTALEEPEA